MERKVINLDERSRKLRNEGKEDGDRRLRRASSRCRVLYFPVIILPTPVISLLTVQRDKV